MHGPDENNPPEKNTDGGAANAVAVAAAISQQLQDTNRTVAVAESLTSGMLATHLGAAENASQWFRGGVVAYSAEVKFSLLGVSEGPVISARCAEQMAAGVAELMKADFGLAVTGAGGPGEQEGQAQGTVFAAVYDGAETRVTQFAFDGEPESVVRAAAAGALQLLLDAQESVRGSAY
jgi:nicotinamide-nucleotide amidase